MHVHVVSCLLCLVLMASIPLLFGYCSLQVLEACVKNCGRKFHQELGKFRFLNELIRMISPKVSHTVLSVITVLACIIFLFHSTCM